MSTPHNTPLHTAFEKLASDSYNFRRGLHGGYQNPPVARDFKWFKLGFEHAQTAPIAEAEPVNEDAVNAKQFVTDVLTAARLVRDGHQRMVLAERLGAGCTNLLAVLSTFPTADAAKDAQRYRLLRRGQHWSVIDWIGDDLRGDELDAAIDAIIVKKAQEAQGPTT